MTGDGVVLLHGIFRTHRSMRRLERYLAAHGLRVLNLSYPSTRMRLEDIATVIHPKIEVFASELNGKLHFVGYSMGGLVVRAYLNHFPPQKLGRVVQIGTPNHGSEVADFVQNWWLYKKLYGPAGAQLVTQLPDAEKVMGTVHYELGIIAGNVSLAPLANYLIDGPNDGKVSVESTKLKGMKQHIVIRANHTYFLWNKTALRQTLNFLRSGLFA